jgi:hypothetical protein
MGRGFAMWCIGIMLVPLPEGRDKDIADGKAGVDSLAWNFAELWVVGCGLWGNAPSTTSMPEPSQHHHRTMGGASAVEVDVVYKDFPFDLVYK